MALSKPLNFGRSNNPLRLQTIDGFPDGMNVNDAPHEISDTQARYLQDIWINTLGLTVRRGPLVDVSGMVNFGTDAVLGVCSTAAPDGTIRYGVLHMTSGGTIQFGVLSSNFGAITNILPIALTGAGAYSPWPIVDIKPAVDGGVWVGVSQQTNASPTYQSLFRWYGGSLARYNTGTLGVTTNSAIVTGTGTTFTGNVVPGMFLSDSTSGSVWGVVKSVDSGTQVTLTEPIVGVLTSAGLAYEFNGTRGFNRMYSAGTVTCDTGHTTVVGGGTAWIDEALDNSWRMYRAKDNTFIGTISSVASNNSIVLGANAAVNMAEEEYFVISNVNAANTSGTINLLQSSFNIPGFLTAAYAGRQWYANRGISPDQGGEWVERLWYSDVTGGENIAMAKASGNFLHVSSGTGGTTPIKQIASAFNSLVVLKELEVFTVNGTDPDTFTVNKLADDGALSTMSAVTYQGGVLWAGRNGIYHYDGATVNNLTKDNLGLYYSNAIKAFDPATYRMWGFVMRDHYFLHIENCTPGVSVVKGSASSTPSYLTIVINLQSGGVTMFTNVRLRGGVTFSTSSGQNGWIAVWDGTKGHLCDVGSLFDSQGNDTVTCSGAVAGPDFYIESKRYHAGNGLVLKVWKEILLNYLAAGDTLRLDTVKGMNTVGVQSATVFPKTVPVWDSMTATYSLWDILGAAFPTWDSVTNASYVAKRIKFLKRDRYFAFRLYQNSSSVTSVIVGAFALAYKLMRIGRV